MRNINAPLGENKSDGPALPKLAYSMREAAQVLGVSYQTVYRLLKRGLIKSSSALRHKLIPVSELERFLKVTLQ
jgi:excisionase family DNA binding protein